MDIQKINVLQYLAMAAVYETELTPYEIKKYLSENKVENWLPVSIESVFYSVNTLYKKKFLEKKRENIYVLSSTGKTEFLSMQQAFLSEFHINFFTYKLAFKFLRDISGDQLQSYTQDYIYSLSQLLEKAIFYKNQYSSDKEKALIQHEILLLKTELDWVKTLQENKFYYS